MRQIFPNVSVVQVKLIISEVTFSSIRKYIQNLCFESEENFW